MYRLNSITVHIKMTMKYLKYQLADPLNHILLISLQYSP